MPFEVHHDVAEVPGERHPAEVGGGGHDLVAAGPVEDHRVEALAAFDDVRAVARIPDEGVVALAEEGRIGASVAVDDVVAATTDEDLVAASAEERVIAVLAVDPCRLVGREFPVDLVDLDGVVAVAGLDVDGVEGVQIEREVGRTVVADVDLELASVVPTHAERDLVRVRAALDVEGAVGHRGGDRGRRRRDRRRRDRGREGGERDAAKQCLPGHFLLLPSLPLRVCGRK